MIIAEDTYVIFNIDVYTNSRITMVNRNVTEDLLRIFCVFIMTSFFGAKILRVLGGSKSEDGEKQVSFAPVEQEEKTKIPVEANVSLEGDTSFEAEIPVEPADVSEPEHDYSKFYLFCKEYQFTVREQDIFGLLLKNKNYNEISEELYISIGTAKAHMHNIFKKTEVKKRSQLIALFENFKIKGLHGK